MLSVVDCIAACVRLAVPQPTEWQRIGTKIDTAFIATGSHFVNAHRTLFDLECLFSSQETFQIGITERWLVLLHCFRKRFKLAVYGFIVFRAALVSDVNFSFLPITNCPIADS